jgi:hypothetical protein
MNQIYFSHQLNYAASKLNSAMCMRLLHIEGIFSGEDVLAIENVKYL